MRPLRNPSGQILIPLLAACLVMIAFSALFVSWGKRSLVTLRMKLAADAAALSCAREQAEMLNKIAVLNTRLNADLVKFGVLGVQLGVTSKKNYLRYRSKTEQVTREVKLFPLRSWEVGQTVAKANGAKTAIWFPILSSRLKPKKVTVLVASPLPPWVEAHPVSNGYYTRVWEPARRSAQPPHKTLWMVRNGSVTAVGKARVWLDVKSSALVSQNGGFPRVKESMLGDLGIQSFYPQFAGRLLPRPLYSWAEMLGMIRGEKSDA